MLCLPKYHLPLALRKHVLATGLSAPPLTLCLDFQVNMDGWEPEPGPEPEDVEGTKSSCGNTLDDAKPPATSTSKGSFNWDREKGKFNLEWDNLAAFETWHWEEEQMYSIKFVASTTQPGTPLYSWCQLFVCGRKASGGRCPMKRRIQTANARSIPKRLVADVISGSNSIPTHQLFWDAM